MIGVPEAVKQVTATVARYGYLRRLCDVLMVAAVFCGPLVSAAEFRVLDQQGQPVANAVVSIPDTEPERVTPAQSVAVMDQLDKRFEPHVLVVETGQAVAFPNSDNIRHHVYSFSKPNQFEIKLYSGRPSEPLQFQHAGVVVLGCNIHDQMKGYLYVVEEEIAAVSNPQGDVSLDRRPDWVYVWHPQLQRGTSARLKQPLDQQDDRGRWLIRLPITLNTGDAPAASGFRNRFR